MEEYVRQKEYTVNQVIAYLGEELDLIIQGFSFYSRKQNELYSCRTRVPISNSKGGLETSSSLSQNFYLTPLFPVSLLVNLTLIKGEKAVEMEGDYALIFPLTVWGHELQNKIFFFPKTDLLPRL